ncbi:nucleotide exchange factor GrpE [Microbacterium sp. SSM24]|uniref:nucleotide exchange factor GrpE n=1 Tax=Microbacterium sp. SSM24 TaxID=2991714 RepID=UPI00222619D0|nr:nucleotide exchange factor GrpE [Microbacterium sp. SSM24]MCW3493317.1 nucleotide exchange factor GrpE [Microbacterium sp. SSM24]
MSGQETPPPESGDDGAADGVADAAKQIAELEDLWRRTAAELENFRKRCAKDVTRARVQERAAVASRWLPVLDNLERALEHAASNPELIVEGVDAVRQQALSVLTDLGYPRREDETGKPFDPARHEAVSTIADTNLVPGTVAHVIRPGYGPDEEILRPASVIVATRSE